jgi:hypothetical protein
MPPKSQPSVSFSGARPTAIQHYRSRLQQGQTFQRPRFSRSPSPPKPARESSSSDTPPPVKLPKSLSGKKSTKPNSVASILTDKPKPTPQQLEALNEYTKMLKDDLAGIPPKEKKTPWKPKLVVHQSGKRTRSQASKSLSKSPSRSLSKSPSPGASGTAKGKEKGIAPKRRLVFR